jgi:hypothetical protein
MNDQLSFPARVRTLKIVHAAMPLVLILLTILVSVLGEELGDPNFPIMLQYVPGAVLLAAFLVSSLLFKRQLKEEIKEYSTLGTKLGAYQTAHLVRAAPFEAAGLFGVVVTMLTVHNYNLIVTAIVLAVFYIYRPTVDRISRELNLSIEERRELEGN